MTGANPAVSGARTAADSERTIWSVILASSAGNIIEWYDFYIFGSLAAIIAPLFYPPGNDTFAYIAYLATFAVGFVVHLNYENPHLSFVTYDDEHHRVAFIDFGPLAEREVGGSDLRYRPTDQPGLHHVAFTFEAMGEFVDNYVRLRDAGIRPFFCVNHGPTTSMYYRDPDGNRVEAVTFLKRIKECVENPTRILLEV